MYFPKENRLLAKTDYNQVLDQPKKISQKQLLILYKSNQRSNARLGLMVGKRVAPLAVARNRIKRVIRESFRANQKKLIGLDCIVIARQQCDTLNTLQLRQGMDQLWERLITQQQNRSFT